MSMRWYAITVAFTITGLYEANGYLSGGRRAAEFENAVCVPNKRHLDLDGCGECICNSHGYGSDCERVHCSRVYRRPIDERECTPYEDFQTYCHNCKCSSVGTPIDCKERRLGCMDRLVERLRVRRIRKYNAARRARKKEDPRIVSDMEMRVEGKN